MLSKAVLVAVLIFQSVYVIQAEICDATTVGDYMCVSCRGVGYCSAYVDSNGDTQYHLGETQDCAATNQYCNEGTPMCSSTLTDANCLCQSSDGGSCIADPNGNTGGYIDCRSGSTVWVQCATYQFHENDNDCTCTNPTCTSPCDVYFEPTQDGCDGYYECGSGTFMETTCIDVCYDTNTCSCAGASTCPSCGYEADPNDSNGWTQCNIDVPVSGYCGKEGEYEFNAATCMCDPLGSQVIACPTCGSRPNPSAECYDFFTCSTGTDISQTCLNYEQGETCYNEETCSCQLCSSSCGRDPVAGNTYQYFDCTTELVGSCSPGFYDPYDCTCSTCPSTGFIEDHDDTTCNGYFYCQGTTATHLDCPNADYCFDAATGDCLPSCPTCGIYADPDDSTKFYHCNLGTDEPIPSYCGGGTVFDATTCKCG